MPGPDIRPAKTPRIVIAIANQLHRQVRIENVRDTLPGAQITEINDFTDFQNRLRDPMDLLVTGSRLFGARAEDMFRIIESQGIQTVDSAVVLSTDRYSQQYIDELRRKYPFIAGVIDEPMSDSSLQKFEGILSRLNKPIDR